MQITNDLMPPGSEGTTDNTPAFQRRVKVETNHPSTTSPKIEAAPQPQRRWGERLASRTSRL